jgi:hypothetical protein
VEVKVFGASAVDLSLQSFAVCFIKEQFLIREDPKIQNFIRINN